MDNEGGIGGIGAAAASEEEPRAPTRDRVDRVLRLEAELRQALDQANHLASVSADLESARQEIVQLKDDQQKIINACAQYQAAIENHGSLLGQHEQKIAALGRALAQNYRVEAARIAASCRQPAETTERLAAIFDMFLKKIEPPPLQQEAPQPSETSSVFVHDAAARRDN